MSSFCSYTIRRFHSKRLSRSWPSLRLHVVPKSPSLDFCCCASTTSKTRSSDSNSHLGNSKFQQLMLQKRLQAKKSIIVQIPSEHSLGVLHKLHNYVPIKDMFYYKVEDGKIFSLLEFATEEDLQKVHSCFTRSCANDVPIALQFLKLNGSGISSDNASSCKLYKHPSQIEVIETLQKQEKIGDQMRALHELTKLQDFGSRLRFMICAQLETALSGIFPNFEVKPFGSSINGFGKSNCDLDMNCFNKCPDKHTDKVQEEILLAYQTKDGLSNSRAQIQRNLETLNDMIKTFLPGYSNVQRILQARVPIIKFYHNFTGLECDFSMSNIDAINMSELLYDYGEYDVRVRPLTFTVLNWSRSNFLNQKSRTTGLTSFQLTVLVLFYLQQMTIIPCMNDLMKIKDNNIVSLDETSDSKHLNEKIRLHRHENNTSLSDLLIGFFDYYAGFDFRKHGISLITGKTIAKPDYSAAYIENPLQPTLNVTSNVKKNELNALLQRIGEALWCLEEPNRIHRSDKPWGIMNLFVPEVQPEKTFRVQNLFPDDEEISTKNKLKVSKK